MRFEDCTGKQGAFYNKVVAGREVRSDRRVVVDPADALAVPERLLGLGVVDEGDDLGAVALGHDLVVEGALLAADRLAAQVLPFLYDAESHWPDARSDPIDESS